MKKFLAVALTCMMSFAVLPPINSSAEFYTDSVGNYYYKNEAGKRVIGFKKIDGKYYYFDTDGIMLRNGLYTIKGSVYRFGKDGVMKTGWHKDENGKYYYFKSDGKAAAGWVKISGKQYYFDKKTFLMCTGKKVIDGATYNFKSNGVWDGKAGIKSPDFRNGCWKDSINTVSSKEKITKLRDGMYIGNSVKVGDYTYYVYYEFDSNGMLYKGEYSLYDEASNIYDNYSCYLAYKQAVEAFTAKYGEPTYANTTYYYNTSLSLWDAVMIDAAYVKYEWETDTTTITLHFMEDDDATPSVYITYVSKNYAPVTKKKVVSTDNV